jgi:hypothetical protein
MHNLTGWQPRPRPTRVVLEGRFCRLEPLDPARHGDRLFAASMAPGAEERFRYLLDSPQDRADFESWLARAAVSDVLRGDRLVEWALPGAPEFDAYRSGARCD